MFTIESTIMDIAMGTEETDSSKASLWFGCVLEVGRMIGIWEIEGCKGAD